MGVALMVMGSVSLVLFLGVLLKQCLDQGQLDDGPVHEERPLISDEEDE